MVNADIRITRIRVRNPQVCIFFGHSVNLYECHSDRTKTFVVRVENLVSASTEFEVGDIWNVRGRSHRVKRYAGKIELEDTQIEAESAELVRPTGSQLIQWIADNANGIREVKSQKLWDMYGERLYDILDEEDHNSVAKIIPSEEVRVGLFEKWLANGDTKTLRFMQESKIPLSLGKKLVRFYKKKTMDKLIEDPYVMLSFTNDWSLVDEIAMVRFGLEKIDQRRMAAALEFGLYKSMDNGHTSRSLDDLYESTRKLLAPMSKIKEAYRGAIEKGVKAGQFVVSEMNVGEQMFHPCGAWIMEKTVTQFIKMLLTDSEKQHALFPVDVDEIIEGFEQDEKVLLANQEFALNEAQVAAVKSSLNNRFSIITGGAGVGKTTVLKALYKALDTLGRPRFQMALSGRATARMIEATHEHATTIASFLRNVSIKKIGEQPIVVIDEASMLDLVTFYRLIRKLPANTHMIMVGDPYQLPPIGAGLILHLLYELSWIPCVELTEVKRQSNKSLIPVIAKSVRNGMWSSLPTSLDGDVSFLPRGDDEIMSEVLSLYDMDRMNTQILCATNSCNFAGVKAINRACHDKYVSSNKPLLAINHDTRDMEQTGFHEGDFLIYTSNDWERNLQNGSLGRLVEVFDTPKIIIIGEGEKQCERTALGRAVYEGAEHYVLDTDIDNIELSYAITVHKAQGSQFQRVIVPVRRSRVLDRTFLYTAITRAQKQVVLVGDEKAIRNAVESLPSAFKRKVGLGMMLAA